MIHTILPDPRHGKYSRSYQDQTHKYISMYVFTWLWPTLGCRTAIYEAFFFLFMAAISTSLWPKPVTVVHRFGNCAPLPPAWEGGPPGTSFASPSAIGMRQAQRQAIRRRETRALLDGCTVEGRLRRRVNDGKDSNCSDIVLTCDLSLWRVYMVLLYQEYICISVGKQRLHVFTAYTFSTMPYVVRNTSFFIQS